MKIRAFAFLADENVHPEVITYLLHEGCDVVTVDERNLRGASDHRIIAAAMFESRVVLTHDSDFGALTVAAGQPVFGIIYLRPGHIEAEFTIASLRILLEGPLDLTPPFLIVAIRRGATVRVRVRSLDPSKPEL